MNPPAHVSPSSLWRGSPAYWFCQCAGWAFFMSAPAFTLFNDWNAPGRKADLPGILLLYACGIGLTHLLHVGIRAFGWKSLPAPRLALRLVLSSLAISLAWCLLYNREAHLAHEAMAVPPKRVIPFNAWCYMLLTYRQFSTPGFFAFHFAFMDFVLGIWLLLYFAAANWQERQGAEAETWRLKAALATAELAALHAQTNPHFLFNALNSLRGLISENPGRAQDAITRLAGILRYSLQLSRVALVPLEEELRAVDGYLELEGLRFEDRLRVTREIDPSTLALLIPPMTVQTLVENAVKYGVSKYPGPNHLAIRTRRKDGRLEIEVANDGQLNASSDSTSIGLRNTTDRLRGLLGASSDIVLASPSPGRVSARIVTPARPPTPA